MRALGNHPVGEPQKVSTFPLVFALFFLTIEGNVAVGHGRLEFGRRVFARRMFELPGARSADCPKSRGNEVRTEQTAESDLRTIAGTI
jgi:hypothetical protein